MRYGTIWSHSDPTFPAHTINARLQRSVNENPRTMKHPLLLALFRHNGAFTIGINF